MLLDKRLSPLGSLFMARQMLGGQMIKTTGQLESKRSYLISPQKYEYIEECLDSRDAIGRRVYTLLASSDTDKSTYSSGTSSGLKGMTSPRRLTRHRVPCGSEAEQTPFIARLTLHQYSTGQKANTIRPPIRGQESHLISPTTKRKSS